MEVLEKIRGYADRMTEIRRDIHAHPEIGFEEVRTSGIVADLLEKFGCEVHRGLSGTGVVGLPAILAATQYFIVFSSMFFLLNVM